MDSEQNEIRTEIEEKKAAIGEKLDALETKLDSAKSTAKSALSLRHHIETRPWTFMALGVGLGYLIGRDSGDVRGALGGVVKKAIMTSVATAALSAIRGDS